MLKYTLSILKHILRKTETVKVSVGSILVLNLLKIDKTGMICSILCSPIVEITDLQLNLDIFVPLYTRHIYDS